MAAPNLKSPTTITGKTQPYACTGTLASALSNSSGSNKVLKVNTIRASNTTSSAGSVDVCIRRSSTDTYFVKNTSIAPNSSFVVTDRNEYIYLEEGDALHAKANASSIVELIINYEEIS